jgi:hypothetical protein
MPRRAHRAQGGRLAQAIEHDGKRGAILGVAGEDLVSVTVDAVPQGAHRCGRVPVPDQGRAESCVLSLAARRQLGLMHLKVLGLQRTPPPQPYHYAAGAGLGLERDLIVHITSGRRDRPIHIPSRRRESGGPRPIGRSYSSCLKVGRHCSPRRPIVGLAVLRPPIARLP